MTMIRELSAAFVIAASVATGTAVPAWAGGPPDSAAAEMSGTYTYQSDTGRLATWSITPCGLGCADVAVTPVTDPRVAPYGGRAQLDGGQWNMTVQTAQAVRCKPPNDTVTVPGEVAFSFDAATLTGTAVNTQAVDGCGDPAGASYQGSFTLTKAG
ncbi:hypothetical protein A5662_20255 [Mycobacteriaceae bacterium 1482268.1]|nr:hypothetical protein A5662_20255 [Mycobacteriaceae bacterium 1482268.1]